MIPGGVTFMMMNESKSMGYIIMINQFNKLEFLSSLRVPLKKEVQKIRDELLFQKTEEYTKN